MGILSIVSQNSYQKVVQKKKKKECGRYFHMRLLSEKIRKHRKPSLLLKMTVVIETKINAK